MKYLETVGQFSYLLDLEQKTTSNKIIELVKILIANNELAISQGFM